MKNTMMRGFLYGLVGGAALTLAGCGGDSSSEGGITKPNIPGAPITITSSNQNQVVAETADGIDGASGGLDIALGAVIQSGGNTSFSAFDFASNQLMNYARQGLSGAPALPAGVTISDSMPCDSGNISISANVSDPNSANTGILSADDSFTLSFNSCRDNIDGTTINGSVTARLTAGSLDMNCDTGCADATMSITFNDMQVTGGGESAIIDGGFSMSRSGTTETISGSSLYVFSTTGEGMHLTNFSISSTDNGSTETSSVTMTIASTHLNGSVTITTPTPLVSNTWSDHPSSGVIVITGDQSGLRVTALSETSVQIELDANGDGNYDETATVSWTTIEQS